MAGRPSWLVLLLERQFRLLWTARLVSSLGDAMAVVAVPFAVLRVGGSATDVGLVLACATLPRVAMLLVGGVWADRLPRRRVLIATDLVQLLSYGLLAVALATGRGGIAALMAANVVAGTASAFFRPAMSAFVPEVTRAQTRQQANALLGLAKSGTAIVGPGLAGLISAYDVGLAFACNAASFAVSGVCLARLRVVPVERPAPAPFLDDLREGWRELTSRRWYLTNLMVHGVWNLAITPFFVLGPVIAAQRLGGTGAWGVVSAVSAIGAVAGGLVVLRVRPRRPLVAANLALTLSAFQLLVLVKPFDLLLVCVAAFVGAAGLSFLNNIWDTTVQRLMPEEALARVSAYDWLISLVAMPVGYAACGPLAQAIGTQATLVWAAVLVSVPCALVVLLPGVRRVGG